MIEVYTDGACSGNPGPGGWAYIIIDDAAAADLPQEKSGAEKCTTNNRMELQAVIAALEIMGTAPGTVTGKVQDEITIYTDSQYVQKGITEWIIIWKRKGWKNSGKEPVKNQDLWQRLDALCEGQSITWAWVKGHAGNKYNERCDFLAQKAIDSLV
jgi:ribonuclease HI